VAKIKDVKLSWITREDIEKINCAAFYAKAEERLHTSDITICIAGRALDLNMAVKGKVILVPNVDRPLSDFCETEWDDFCICIQYTQDGYLPTDTLTRAEFIMQTLDIWEHMYERTRTVNPKMAEEIQIASSYLRGTYKVEELMNIGSTANEIDTIKYTSGALI
jgi:hypothetical protein